MKTVDEKLFIAPQLDEAAIRLAAAKGVRKIINNRPDGEEPGQPSAAHNRKIAEDLGMSYAHIPVTPGQVSEEQVREFQKEMAQAEGPVVAHCKSGARALTLWAIGEVLDGRMNKNDIAKLGERMGVDIGGARKWLDSRS